MAEKLEGFFSCDGMKLDDWKRANRIPMFPDRVQRWIVATNRGPVDATLNTPNKAVIADEVFIWLATQGTIFGFAPVRNKQAVEKDLPVNIDADSFNVIAVLDDLGHRARYPGFDGKAVKGLTKLEEPPLQVVRGENVKWVLLEFLYTGGNKTLAWPFGDAGGGAQCAEDANIATMAVFRSVAPSQAAPVPPKRSGGISFSDLVPDFGKKTGLGGIGSKIDKAVTVTLVVGGAIVLWQLYGATQDARKRVKGV